MSLYLEFNHRLDSKQDPLLHIVVITGKYLVIDITGSIELVHEIPTYITIDTSTDIDTICHQYNKAGSFSNSDFREQDMRLFQINKLEECTTEAGSFLVPKFVKDGAKNP